MIIDLVDKLLDRLIQLARYQQEVRQNLFENYVVPAYSQFEIVHNNYLETFKNYRELIKSADKTTDIKSSILDKIKEESLFYFLTSIWIFLDLCHYLFLEGPRSIKNLKKPPIPFLAIIFH